MPPRVELMATLNGIEGILSTSQAPSTIPRFVLPATPCRYGDQFATLLTTLLTRNQRAWSPRPNLRRHLDFASNYVQNAAIRSRFRGWKASKANCINRVYGAGDGNRTHVRSLGNSEHFDSLHC
jgi:hypothetical protein